MFADRVHIATAKRSMRKIHGADKVIDAVYAGRGSAESTTGILDGMVDLGDIDPEDHKLEWLVEDLLPRGCYVALSGKPKGGKSTLVRTLLSNSAAGGTFLGRKVPKFKALVLSEEPLSVFLKQLPSGFDRTGVKVVPLVPMLDSASFATSAGIDKLVNDLVGEFSVWDFDLIVIDTLGHLLPGDPNSYKDMMKNLSVFPRLADRTGACVLTLAHTGKATGRVMGTSGNVAVPDVSIVLETNNNKGKLKLTPRISGIDKTIPVRFDGERFHAAFVAGMTVDEAFKISGSTDRKNIGRVVKAAGFKIERVKGSKERVLVTNKAP